MKSLLLILVFMALPNLTLAGPKATSETQFGGKITTQDISKLSEVVKNFENYDGKTVAFEAQAEKVCEKKGCWMVLKDGDQEVRTLFKDYGFFVPKDILGKKVKVQGTMKKKHVSAATLRHYKKDAGASKEEVKKIVTGEEQFEFEADAVEII